MSQYNQPSTFKSLKHSLMSTVNLHRVSDVRQPVTSVDKKLFYRNCTQVFILYVSPHYVTTCIICLFKRAFTSHRSPTSLRDPVRNTRATACTHYAN